MSRTSDFEKKPSQFTASVKPIDSFLQTRAFAPLQMDLDEDVPHQYRYSENILEKLINQPSTQSSDTPIQAKPKNRLKVIATERRAIQAKLNIGEPNDKYEKEADVTASRVVQQINSPNTPSVNSSVQDLPVQRQKSEEEEELQMKPLLQRRKNIAEVEASSDLESSIQSARGSGQSLDKNLQQSMGQAMAADFSSVKIHTDSQSDQLNKSIQAKAFTTGQDVFFRQGAYEPSSRGGQELIAHELTHVVQQNGAISRMSKKELPKQSMNSINNYSETSEVTKYRNPNVPSSPQHFTGSQLSIQRAEIDAVNLANELDNTGNYETWANVREARNNGVLQITANWKKIAKAYVAKGIKFDNTAALETEATRLIDDERSWTDPQARREASNVLSQMVKMRKKIDKKLATTPKTQSKKVYIETITNELLTLHERIKGIQDKFLMANRLEGEGSKTTHKGFGKNKNRTVLEMPQGGNLELYNKVNPATNQEQRLGEGGLGYGRFGKLDGETRFVKKQKLKKNERSAALGVNMPLYEQAEAMQTQQLEWIEEEMNKFRHELDITTNRLDHQNIIKTYGGMVGTGKDGMPKAYMVMDMMTGGDLKGVINKKTADDKTKKKIMKGALDGLAHVHENRLIHRDIKPENIMLDSGGNAKLIDFGEAVDMDDHDEYRTKTKAGTAGYYHPTKIRDVDTKVADLIYDVSTDLYALQKTFIELAPALPALNDWIGTFLAVNDAAILSSQLDSIVVE